MKVLFICDEYPPGKNGGIGTSVQVLGRELVKQGHTVFVCGLYSFGYGEKDFETDAGVQVWRLRYGLNFKQREFFYKIYRKLPAFINRFLNGRSAFEKYIQFIQELIRKEKIEIIECPDFHTFSMFIGFPVRWPKFDVPLVVKAHGSYSYFNHEMGWLINPVFFENDKALLERAEALASVSNYTASVNEKLFSTGKTYTILPNAIPLQGLPKENTVKEKAIFTGALIEKKGIFQLMKAWNEVNVKKPQAQLYVYGKGKIETLKALLSADALSTVHFMGHVDRQLLFKEISSASVAVFPSYSETFGLMAIEAMALNCPVIYTKRSCGPEIIENGKEGLLVDPDNVDEIAESVLKVFSSPDLCENFRKNARKKVEEKFNIVSVAAQHVKFYEQVCKSFKTK